MLTDNPSPFAWQEELKAKYPDMLSQLICFEHDEGWRGILEELFDSIQRFEAVANIEDYEPVRFVQIKEKWGTLRIYYDGGYSEMVQKYVRCAEAASGWTCEVCGLSNPNIIKPCRSGGWIRTRCSACLAKEKR